jgi:hypothetical protein
VDLVDITVNPFDGRFGVASAQGVRHSAQQNGWSTTAEWVFVDGRWGIGREVQERATSCIGMVRVANGVTHLKPEADGSLSEVDDGIDWV